MIYPRTSNFITSKTGTTKKKAENPEKKVNIKEKDNEAINHKKQGMK